MSSPLQDAIDTLEAIRSRLCPYPGPTCDCKFGMAMTGTSEQTGCPELRSVIDLLRERLETQPEEGETAFPVGRIVISYFLDEDGQPKVNVDRPDFDVIPALVQLGIVRYADYSIMHGSGDQEID